MSLDTTQIDSLIQSATPSFHAKKTSIVNFLREVYSNISKQSNNVIMYRFLIVVLIHLFYMFNHSNLLV